MIPKYQVRVSWPMYDERDGLCGSRSAPATDYCYMTRGGAEAGARLMADKKEFDPEWGLYVWDLKAQKRVMLATKLVTVKPADDGICF